MKSEKYLKLIFENGSMIFRKVKSFTKCEPVQTITIVFENGNVSVVDMIHIHSIYNKLLKIKTNIN